MESQEAFEYANTVQHWFTIPIQMCEWQCTATTLCLSDDDGLKHIDSLLKSENTAYDMGAAGIRRVRREESSVREPELGLIKLDSTWTLNLT